MTRTEIQQTIVRFNQYGRKRAEFERKAADFRRVIEPMTDEQEVTEEIEARWVGLMEEGTALKAELEEISALFDAIKANFAEKQELMDKISDWESYPTTIQLQQRQGSTDTDTEDCYCRGNYKDCIWCGGTGIKKRSPNKPDKHK
jgi:hypothetical protein